MKSLWRSKGTEQANARVALDRVLWLQGHDGNHCQTSPRLLEELTGVSCTTLATFYFPCNFHVISGEK